MKFVEAIKAMGPGQLLVSDGVKFEIVNGTLRKVGSDRDWILDGDWSLIDKPRPRVRFDAAMRAALEGKQIVSFESHIVYVFKDSVLCRAICKDCVGLLSEEMAGDWGILDQPEVGK